MKTFFKYVFISGLIALLPVVAKSSNRYTIRQKQLKDGTSIIVLSDKLSGIEASVAPARGGELSGLRVFYHNQWNELLFHALDYGDFKGWRGKAPLLWPAVGRNYATADDLKNNKLSYMYDGTYYNIPIHGFIRFNKWKVVGMTANKKKSEVVLTTEDDSTSLKIYPFKFKFYVIHRITNGRYEVYYMVKADKSNQKNMFFSIGNHITFNVPLIKNSPLDSCYFETPLTEQIYTDEKGIPTGKSGTCSYMPKVPITGFKALEAISLGGYYENDPWVKLSDPSGLSLIIITHAQSQPNKPFIQFNIWGDVNNGYFSMEPWEGLQDSFNLYEGLIYLQPGKFWKWNFKVNFIRK